MPVLLVVRHGCGTTSRLPWTQSVPGGEQLDGSDSADSGHTEVAVSAIHSGYFGNGTGRRRILARHSPLVDDRVPLRSLLK